MHSVHCTPIFKYESSPSRLDQLQGRLAAQIFIFFGSQCVSDIFATKKYVILSFATKKMTLFFLHNLALSDLLWLYPWIWITLLLDLAHSGELLLSQALIGSQVLDSLRRSHVAKVYPALLHMLTYLDANSNPNICIYASNHTHPL